MNPSNATSSRTGLPSGPRGSGDSSSSTAERFALDARSHTLDPRIHAYRQDLADIALAGRVFAPHYARPLIRSCGLLQTCVRSAPDSGAEPVSELLPGERFAVLEFGAGWAWGYCAGDRRVGYVEAIELVEPAEPTHIVCEASAPIEAEGDISSPVLARLPMGSLLTGYERGACLATEIGCVPTCYLRPVGEHESDPAAVAERLIDVPYRKGGRSFHGIDSAGLVQVALGLCGIEAPRDPDLQMAMGEPVPEGEPLRRGDLVFSEQHVAMAVDAENVIHVSWFSRKVAVEPLDEAHFPTSQGEGPAPIERRRIAL